MAGPWTCFFCGETFVAAEFAKLHFGISEDQTPACRIKASDGGLLRALRESEDALWEATSALHAESADALKAWRSAQGRHYTALVSAEEAGYARGMDDMRHEIERLRRIVAFNGVHCMVPSADLQQDVDEAIRFVADNPAGDGLVWHEIDLSKSTEPRKRIKGEIVK